jgi:hypothetical protein
MNVHFKFDPLFVKQRMADIFCDSSMEDFQVKACGIDFAGVIGLALLDPSLAVTETNLKSSTWWETTLAASPQLAYLIKNTRGELPAGAVTTEEGFGREDTQVTGASRSATIEYEGMIENYKATEGANRRKWKLVFFTSGDVAYYVDSPASFFATPVVGRDKKVGQFYQATLSWQNFSNPIPFDAPDNLI